MSHSLFIISRNKKLFHRCIFSACKFFQEDHDVLCTRSKILKKWGEKRERKWHIGAVELPVWLPQNRTSLPLWFVWYVVVSLALPFRGDGYFILSTHLKLCGQDAWRNLDKCLYSLSIIVIVSIVLDRSKNDLGLLLKW